MPRTGNYSITIEVSGNVSSESPISGDKTGGSDTEKGKNIVTKDSLGGIAKKLISYHTVKSFADQVISHEVSMVELRTGSREMQERANFMLGMSQKVVSVGESMVTGALVGGPAGVAVAVMGMALNIMQTAISYQQKQQTLNTERTLENQTIRMNYVRAGANGSRRQ